MVVHVFVNMTKIVNTGPAATEEASGQSRQIIHQAASYFAPRRTSLREGFPRSGRASCPARPPPLYEDGESIFRALQAGACGYLLKRSEPERVLTAIKEAQEGGAPMSSQIARRVVFSFRAPAPNAETATLTEREAELLSLLSNGFANKEIADQMNISVPTVRTHLRHIYEKLHVRSRTKAIVKTLGSNPATRSSRLKG